MAEDRGDASAKGAVVDKHCLVLQRLDDVNVQLADVRGSVGDVRGSLAEVRGSLEDLRASMADLRRSTGRRFDALDRRWAWSVDIVAMMALGLMAKLLVPGA